MKSLKMDKKTIVKTGVVLGLSFMAAAASASVIPTEGDLGYPLYDIAVNDILKGPVGFVGGLGAIIFSATQLATNWKPALFGIVGGTVAMNADTVVSTMGALI